MMSWFVRQWAVRLPTHGMDDRPDALFGPVGFPRSARVHPFHFLRNCFQREAPVEVLPQPLAMSSVLFGGLMGVSLRVVFWMLCRMMFRIVLTVLLWGVCRVFGMMFRVLVRVLCIGCLGRLGCWFGMLSMLFGALIMLLRVQGAARSLIKDKPLSYCTGSVVYPFKQDRDAHRQFEHEYCCSGFNSYALLGQQQQHDHHQQRRVLWIQSSISSTITSKSELLSSKGYPPALSFVTVFVSKRAMAVSNFIGAIRSSVTFSVQQQRYNISKPHICIGTYPQEERLWSVFTCLKSPTQWVSSQPRPQWGTLYIYRTPYMIYDLAAAAPQGVLAQGVGTQDTSTTQRRICFRFSFVLSLLDGWTICAKMYI